ncbi:hypothetical protein THASP1DRAFT_32806 [Thamnocephalis sphaerospora]|uniref:Uncharacterized protein n=1 Tax=Thamnocephalis sphaerospora TaxID=78915 RepID=A0A4P9XI14_9FUNG|nr:hypothetical protein THASP1DRAFT_32806 [Thamnocephalis sphaerospora]|eukprot:RKP05354.1 hypothetical protein THASP1DRAFT_32806 [Thamnocephalis sphaerospora]
MSSEHMDLETINGFHYLVLAKDDHQEMAARYLGQVYQLVVGVFTLWAFLNSTLDAVHLVIANRRQSVRWICLIQAISGATYGSILVSISLPGGTGCHTLIYIGGPLLTISTICTDAVLIMKAYIAHGRSRSILYLGIFLVVLQFAPLFVVLRKTKVYMTIYYGCLAELPNYYPWLRLGLDLPINLLFSVAFLHVVVSNYSRYGSDAWRRLSREGIMYMLYAAIINIVTAAIVATRLLGKYSQYIYLLDWYLSSYLILVQQERAISNGGSGGSAGTPVAAPQNSPLEAVVHTETTFFSLRKRFLGAFSRVALPSKRPLYQSLEN